MLYALRSESGSRPLGRLPYPRHTIIVTTRTHTTPIVILRSRASSLYYSMYLFETGRSAAWVGSSGVVEDGSTMDS